MELSDWYQVRFDDDLIYRSVAPPEHDAWTDDLAWSDVRQVCLEMEGMLGSDSMHIFTRARPESYAIPMLAAGATELLAELVRRGLFDGQMAIDAASSELGLFCWPPVS